MWYDIMNAVREQEYGEQHDNPHEERMDDERHNDDQLPNEQYMKSHTEMEITHLGQNQQNNSESHQHIHKYPTQLNTNNPLLPYTPTRNLIPTPHYAYNIPTPKNIMSTQHNPYWKVQSNKPESIPPHHYIQENPHENITYPLITKLHDQPLQPLKNEQRDKAYVVKNSPETPSLS